MKYNRARASRNFYRKKLAARGYMPHSLYFLKKITNGGSSLFGDSGTQIAEHRVDLDPPPLLFNFSMEEVAASNGTLREGDIRIMQIAHEYLSYLEDPSYIMMVEGPQFNGAYSMIEGSNLEVTPLAIAVKARRMHE